MIADSITMKAIVEQYLEGFRCGDQAKILKYLSEDVIWRLHGCETFKGKAAFAANIENDEFCELPRLEIRELIEAENRVVAIGSGAMHEGAGTQRTFMFCEVFVFDGQLISEIDTFHVWNG